MGHKAQHRAHTGHDAVLNQAVEPAADAQSAQCAVHQPGNPFAEQNVIGPVGSLGADGEGEAAHGNGIDAKHHAGENGQGQNPVGHDPVDLIGDGETPGSGLLLYRLGHNAADVGIALIGDDTLGIVVQLLLAVQNVLLQMLRKGVIQLEGFQNLFVPLKDFDGIPAQVSVVHFPGKGLLDMGKGVFHAAGKHVGQLLRTLGRGGGYGLLGRIGGAFSLEGAHFRHFTAQGIAQLGKIDLVPVFPNQIHHIDRNHHGNSQLDELCGEVEVALDVGAVHDVQNGVGPLTDQIVPGDHLFQCVGGQGVNTGQILNDHVFVPLQAAFLFFHRDAGPVAHILVGAGQGVE